MSAHVSRAGLPQGDLWELVVLLLIAAGEMTSAAKAHMGGDCPDAP